MCCCLQDGNALSLCELEAMLRTVERAHANLSEDLCLESWHDMWARTDDRLSIQQYSSRVASACIQVTAISCVGLFCKG